MIDVMHTSIATAKARPRVQRLAGLVPSPGVEELQQVPSLHITAADSSSVPMIV